MRLGDRRAGSRTLFMDSTSDEVLLEVVAGEDGSSLVAFKLYDAKGELVIDSPEPQAFPLGICVKSAEAEVLLEIPPGENSRLSYRLYDQKGRLLTFSDGKRTQIYGGLRMDGKTSGIQRPASSPTPTDTSVGS